MPTSRTSRIRPRSRAGRAASTRDWRRSTVAAGFVTGMLAGAAARHFDCAVALATAGIDAVALSHPGARVPLKNYAALYNALCAQLGDEGFALFSAPLRPGTFEFLCRSMITSATLADALDRASRFLRLVLPDLEVGIERTASLARIVITERHALAAHADDPRRVFAFEWLLRLLHGLACWMVRRELGLNSVHFPYAQPAHFADYALIYTSHSVFGGDKLVASLNPNLLDLPVRQDENALESFLVDAPGKITMLYRRDRDMVHQVRDLLAQAFPEPFTLDDAAHKLNLSPRSLHRRLQEEDSSFRAIKNALRRDLALSQIEKTELPVAEIAAGLGFADPSTFFRAFQSWTGLAPTDYRSRLAGQRKATNHQ